jgi:hypothetical protein
MPQSHTGGQSIAQLIFNIGISWQVVKLKLQSPYRRERTPDRPVRSGLLYQIRELGFQNEELRLQYTKLILYQA